MAQPPALGNTSTGSMVDRAGISAFPGSAGRRFLPRFSSRSLPLRQAAQEDWRVAGHHPALVKEFSDCPQALPISKPAAKTNAPPRTT